MNVGAVALIGAGIAMVIGSALRGTRRATPFGRAVLREALHDEETRMAESWGHNDGPEIRELYLDPFADLGVTPGVNYCALAVMSWIARAAATTGIRPPIEGSPSAQETMRQFQMAGLWTPRLALSGELHIGDVLVWDRSKPPGTGWQGHIGLVESFAADGFVRTVEANSDRQRNENGEILAVSFVDRALDDALLFGAGRWS